MAETHRGIARRYRWLVATASSRWTALGLAAVIAVLVVQPIRVLAGVGVFLLAAVLCLTARALLQLRRQVPLLFGQSVDASGALWGLLGLITGPGRLLPRLTGAALDPEAAHALADLVIRTRPQTVVELGPGATTVLLGLASGSFDGPMEIWSVEDDDTWSNRAEQLVGYHAIPRCQVVTAPLTQQRVGNWEGRWYSPDAVASLPDRIDVLVVDGPDNVRQLNARYPAYPMLRTRLATGGTLFVHDTDRADESNMVADWMGDGSLREESCGSTFVVLRVE